MKSRIRKILPLAVLLTLLLVVASPLGATPPTGPVITEPSTDGAVANPADVHMEAGGYSDPDGNTHDCSDWEISAVVGDEVVWQASCAADLLKVHIHLGDGAFTGSYAGRSTLEFDRDYRLRVRFKDSAGETSLWSERLFRTSRAGPPGQPGPIPWAVRQIGYQVEIVATGFQLPVNIAFVPQPGTEPGDPFFYVSELYGAIKVVTRDATVRDYATGLLNFNPTGAFPGSGEQGLTGIVADPETGDLFASLVYEDTSSPASPRPHYSKVIRLHSEDGGLTAATQTVVLDMVGEPTGQSHQVSNLTIGPDGKLFVHVGDGFETSRAQDLDSFRGKILRLDLSGAPVPDNPHYASGDGITARDYIYARGFRNPFGGDWRESDEKHYEVENGPSVDRLARVLPGVNYGWDGTDASMAILAAYNWPQPHAPVNLAFVQPGRFTGSGFPAGKMDHAFVSESGPTYASGPQSLGKRISEFTFGANGSLTSGPTPLIEYTGVGKATVAALSAGPDGLYFSDLYKDLAISPIERGANVYRVRYVSGQPPSVGITSPTNGTIFLAPASIVIDAAASDADGTITRVDFFADALSLGSDTSSPYSVTWSNAPPGTYSLTARTTDSSGAIAWAPAVRAIVTDEGPIFGNTVAGTLALSPSAGYKFGTVHVLGEAGTATSFHWYAGGGGAAQKFTPVIYNADASGNPTSFVANGAEVTIAAGQADGWVRSALPPVPLSPGRYLLGLLSGPVGTGAINHAQSAANAGIWNANAYPTPSSAWGAINREAYRWSSYVVYARIGPPSAAPTNTSLPTITGTPQQGQSLTGDRGTWSGSPSSYTDQWRRCDSGGNNCLDIGGATSTTYTLVADDVNARIRFAVTATNGFGPTTAVSAPTALVSGPPPPGSSGTFGNTVAGSLALSPGAGYKFGTVHVLAESGTATIFRWYARGGGSSQKFTPVLYNADASGNPTSFVANGAEVTIAAGQAAGWVTSALPSIPLAPGRYLLGLLSGPNGSGAFNYAESVPSAGVWNANASPYPTPSSPWGAINRESFRWSFHVEYTTGGSSSSPPTNTSLPTITGTPQQGQTLSGDRGTWTGSPTSYTDQWQRCDGAGNNCIDIGGATSTTYTLVADDVNARIRFAVTARNGFGPTTAVSAPTGVVTGPPPPGSSGTFGNTVAGALALSPGAGYKFGTVHVLAESGTATAFRWYARGGGASQKFTPVIYNADASGNPTSFVAKGAEVTIAAGQAAGWVTSALPSVALSPGRYLLGLLSGPNGNGAFNYAESVPSAGVWNANASPYPTPSSPWGAINREGFRWSFHVNYTLP